MKRYQRRRDDLPDPDEEFHRQRFASAHRQFTYALFVFVVWGLLFGWFFERALHVGLMLVAAGFVADDALDMVAHMRPWLQRTPDGG